MVRIVKSVRELNFSGLMAVYAQTNRETAEERWPEESEYRGLLLAESEFYDYLTQVFFRTPGARYAVWEEGGRYVSALRLEPYRDGLLLAALETAPEFRCRGYAEQLIRAVLETVSETAVYAHVDKANTPSRRTHEACGFEKILDYGVYADGSVFRSSVTYCRKERDCKPAGDLLG